MTIYKFPSDFGRGRDPKKEKNPSMHHPEFIDIEDLREDEILLEEESGGVYSSVGQLEKVSLPFLLRIFTFGISIALFVGSFFLFLLTSFVGIISLLMFAQARSVNAVFLKYWRFCKRMFVTALGLLIMCASPALGMGFIALYFALQGESVEGNILDRFFRSSN